mgnify:CR=1 FL=1
MELRSIKVRVPKRVISTLKKEGGPEQKCSWTAFFVVTGGERGNI